MIARPPSIAIDTPLVSVVIAVYNAAEFLEEAIESIRRQTYPNWELICWDDGSVDGSWEMLQSLAAKDQRIQVFRDGTHRGVAGAANMALSKAKGRMIARMDADDIAYADRLKWQVAYLLEHPLSVAVGGQCDLIDHAGKIIGTKLFPTDPKKVKQMIFSTIPVQQPTLAVSCDRLGDDFWWYREGATVAIEVELLFRLFQRGDVANLKETVLKYRIHDRNISLRNPRRTFFVTLKGRIKALFCYGYRPTAGGVLATVIQMLLVTFMPARWIYPVYTLVQRIRGMRKQQTIDSSGHESEPDFAPGPKVQPNTGTNGSLLDR
jgi:glycosyltransferase involved in cell wall biosynthesis